MGRKLTTEEFIEKAKKIHVDRYDYSLVEYKRSNEKIIIICKEHGEFLQTPNTHLDNHGCPECSKLKRRRDLSKNIDEKLYQYIIENPIELSGNLKIIGTVYLFVNSTNNKKYIGKTITRLSSRLSAHLNKSKHSEYYFYRAIRKYSWDGFNKYVIFQTNVLDNNKENKKLIDSIICDKEVEFIKLFNTTNKEFGYNETDGGDGISGKQHSEETRLKMSISRSGSGNSMFGKTLGKNPRSIPILQLDSENNIIKEWSCAVEIYNELGYSKTMIRNCYNDKYEFYKGYK